MTVLSALTFLSSPLLWALAALSLPIIIHLLNRKRHRVIKWAAMEFILKATRESRGKKKLKHIIILTSRALAIAALVFAVAQPVLDRMGAAADVKTIILVLDRSPSMELSSNEDSEAAGLSKRQLVIQNVKKSMAQLDGAQLLLIDSASEQLTEITSPESLDSLSQTAASDKAANIPRLISSAINHATNTDRSLGKTEIWLASDQQGSNWKVKDKQWKTINELLSKGDNMPKLRFLSMTANSTNNRFIQVRKSWREGKYLIIESLLSRPGMSNKETIEVTYSINEGQFTDLVDIDSDSKLIRKQIPLPASTKKGFGTVAITPDDNARDNISYFAFGEQVSLHSALVSEGGESELPLKKALSLPGYSHLSCEVFNPSQAGSINFSTTPVIIWQAPLPSKNIATQLEKYIESGGIIIFFPSESDSDNSFLDISWGAIEKAESDDYYFVDQWNQREGPFRDGVSGHVLPFAKMETIQRRSINGDSIPLASWDDGSTFATRKILGSGRALFLGTLPDFKWSQLADNSAIHILAVYRMLELASERFSAVDSASVGSDRLDLRANESRLRIDQHDSEEIGSGEFQAGIWQLGQRIIAANRPTMEDEVLIIEEAAIQKAIPDVDFSLLTDKGEDKPESFRDPIWQAFLYFMLCFLIIEALLTLPKLTKKVAPSFN